MSVQVLTPRTALLTAVAMSAFAGNSLLCRIALRDTSVDAASFTAVRLLSGAVVLVLLLRRRGSPIAGSYRSALVLFCYAAAFSFAYLKLQAGTGALLQFGAVQLGMLGVGIRRGERLTPRGLLGLLLALGGLVVLLLPGASAPPVGAALLMLLAGLSWAAYSLLGKGVPDPLATSAGNFLRAVPLALGLAVVCLPQRDWDGLGLAYAVLSGALTSGVGYAIWYAALRGLGALQASTVQLSVPVLAALAGAVVLDESLTLRLALTSVAVLAGVALCLTGRRPTSQASTSRWRIRLRSVRLRQDRRTGPGPRGR